MGPFFEPDLVPKTGPGLKTKQTSKLALKTKKGNPKIKLVGESKMGSEKRRPALSLGRGPG